MQYENIVFLQGDAAVHSLELIEKYTPKAAIIFLQCMYEGMFESTVTEEVPWGDGDQTYKSGEVILSWNNRIGYIGLCRFTQNVKTESI